MFSGCAASVEPRPIEITLDTTGANGSSTVRAAGLSSDEVAALRRAAFDDTAWHQLFAIRVAGPAGPATAGRYEIADDAVIFHPAFPLDAGRQYIARFNPQALPSPRGDAPVETTLALPAAEVGPPTRVTAVWPAGAVWPENLLRFYVHFSAPMSRTSSAGRVRIEEASGEEVEGALLPLDIDLWNHDYTRYTVFFDPGRVKRGLRPNLELGRPLHQGRRYVVVVDAGWLDGSGRRLAGEFRHAVAAGPEQVDAIDPRTWDIQPPVSGSRTPLTVTFPWPLDRALAARAIGVAGNGAGSLEGDITIDQDDRRWRFTPAQPWSAGTHELVVLTLLEDAAGNAVGRAFEVEMFRRPAAVPDEHVRVPFAVRAGG